MGGIELLGVMRVMKDKQEPWNTGINVNTKELSRHAYIYLASTNFSMDDNTIYEFGVIRLGYNGDHATRYKIAGDDVIQVSVVDSKLVITSLIANVRTYITLIG